MEMENKNLNDCHDRGELPPIGSHLEVAFGNKSLWHECVVLPSKKIAIDRYAGWHVMAWQDDFEFRPIKTEREKFVERYAETVLSIEQKYDSKFIGGILYESGMRYVE
jgi:hypothetical protein